MRQWRKSPQRWLSSAAMLTFVLFAPTRAALGQGNSDFGHSHKASDPGNSDFGHSHNPSDPGSSDIGQSPSIPTPEPATLTLLALGGGAVALGARFRKGRRK